ncbi:MAG: MAPEG family protein [Gammaproteobacteria bacterium]
MLVTPAYAAILALVFVFLSVLTINKRRSAGAAIGDGGQVQLQRAIRVHANFAEYVPFALLLIYFLEISSRIDWLIHILCLVLISGRLLHAYGVSQARENLRYRITGMAMTFTVIVTAAGVILISSLL